MAHVREQTRTDGTRAYEMRWRQHGRFKQRTFKAKREAERFALRVEDEVEKGTTTDVYVKRSKTVRDVVEASMASSRPQLKPRTFTSYRQNYENHVLPAFGNRRVSSVSSQEVEAWVQSLTDKGLAPASVRNNFVALTKAFKYAVKHDLISKNPCAGTALPVADAEHEFQAQVLTPAQIEAVASALPAPYDLIVRFAGATGLRPGSWLGSVSGT